MLQAGKLIFVWLLLLPFVTFSANAASADESRANYDSNRVARISFVRGDVQIRRADSREWEEAVPNLPVVEGDRLATGQDSRVEIQFDRDNYLRLAEDSILKIVTLSETGVAVSLPEGSLSLRVGKFKRNTEFFEIDAPETTVAIEREGLYRVDAPVQTRGSELLLTVRANGQARVYSETSGYTVRSGRTARILLDGESAGDVDFTAANNADYFDDWIAEREDKLAKQRRAEYYGYYDPAIYGADDLNEYGEWVNTDRYGWVWRPYRSATASYDDWTPFRHGHWRYIPGYGWTWIAQEPWAWATSHHGRWVWIDNSWNWCPYEDRARRRSRWQAALVVFVNIGRNICWYPQPYGYYSSYNRGSRRVVYNTTIINNNIVVNPSPTPTPNVPLNPNDVPRRGIDQLRDRNRERELEQIPIDEAYAGAVTKMPSDSFGKVTRGMERVGKIEAMRAVDALKKGEKQIELPEYSENADAKVERGLEIVNKRPSLKEADREIEANTRIGAMPREKNAASDTKLRDERVFKGRQPTVRDTRRDGAIETSINDNAAPPRTGVFDRQPNPRREKPEQNSDANKREESFERPQPRQPRLPKSEDRDRSTREIENSPGREEQTERPKPPRQERKENRKENRDDDNNNRRPIYQPPPLQIEPEPQPREPEKREEPRREEPRREIPRYEPPPQREEPKREEPRREEPKREEPPRQVEQHEEPRREEPKQQEPPREEPKREIPPSRIEMKSEKEDNR